MKKSIIPTIACIAGITLIGVACSAETTETSVMISEQPVIMENEADYTIGTLPSIENFATDDSLYGSWRGDRELTYQYTFNDDNTGEFLVTDGEDEVVFGFTYTVDNGTLSILHDQTASIEDYTYELTDEGLLMTDSEGMVYTYYSYEEPEPMPDFTDYTETEPTN